MKICVGTSGYSYKEWKGTFYPDKISPDAMLGFYSERFGTVEINNTFYRMPKASVLTSWSGQTPADFVFAVKAPQVITHRKRLKNASDETHYLFKTLSVLNHKLGPVLFQFPKSFRADPKVLEDFLALLPGQARCAFEFRNPSWLDDGLLGSLTAKGCSLCLADTDEEPRDEIISTTSWGYLRLRRSNYADADLSRWMERIRSQKWETAFVFFKHEGEARAPEMAMRFLRLAEGKAAA
jgi:uncharacterized protein YecE (DUF72 family)